MQWKKLRYNRAAGCDEIVPEFIKKEGKKQNQLFTVYSKLILKTEQSPMTGEKVEWN